MAGEIKRDVAVVTVTADTVLADATAVDIQQYAGAVIFIPSGASSQVVTPYVAPTVGGTYLPLYDKSGTAITYSVVASRAYDLHSAAFAGGGLKLVAATGDQAGITLSLKS